MKRFLQSQWRAEQNAFKEIQEDVCAKMYATSSAAEQMLQLSFREANVLEDKAASGKAEVERAKAKRTAMMAKYKALKQSFRHSINNGLSTSEISRLVAAQSEAEDSSLNLDESETTFQTIVLEYEERMPEIITTIRRLNQKRIEAFKTSSKNWCEAQRKMLTTALGALDHVEKEVDAIDASKDLKSFMAGTTDFWAIGRASQTNAEQADTIKSSPEIDTSSEDPTVSQPTSSGATEPPDGRDLFPNMSQTVQSTHLTSNLAAVVMTANPDVGESRAVSTFQVPDNISEADYPVCYALNLWGSNGFPRAETQAMATKGTIKQFVVLLEEWTALQDIAMKKFQNAVKVAPLKIPAESTEQAVWISVRQRILAKIKSFHNFHKLLCRLTSGLRVAKGQLKTSVKRFVDHKAKLQKDIGASYDWKIKAHEKRTRAQQAFQSVEADQKMTATSMTMTQPELEKRVQRTDKAGRELKEAEHQYILADRNNKAMQLKCDVCTGRILGQYEEKEKITGVYLKTSLMYCTQMLRKHFSGWFFKEDENILNSLQKLDVSADFTAYINETCGKSDKGETLLKDGDPVNFAVLGADRFNVAVELSNRSFASTKYLSAVLLEVAGIQETYAKSLRRISFKSIPCAHSTLARSFEAFSKLFEDMILLMEHESTLLKNLVRTFAKQRHASKNKLKELEKQYADLEKAYQKAIADKFKASQEVVNSNSTLRDRESRLEKAIQEKEKKSWKTMMMGQLPLESLKMKKDQAWKDLMTSKTMLKNVVSQLTNAENHRSIAVSSLFRQIQEDEEKWKDFFQRAMVDMVEDRRKLLVKFDSSIVDTLRVTEQVDMTKDIMEFLRSKNTGIRPPKCVIADVLLRVEDEKVNPRQGLSLELMADIEISSSRRSLNIFDFPTKIALNSSATSSDAAVENSGIAGATAYNPTSVNVAPSVDTMENVPTSTTLESGSEGTSRIQTHQTVELDGKSNKSEESLAADIRLLQSEHPDPSSREKSDNKSRHSRKLTMPLFDVGALLGSTKTCDPSNLEQVINQAEAGLNEDLDIHGVIEVSTSGFSSNILGAESADVDGAVDVSFEPTMGDHFDTLGRRYDGSFTDNSQTFNDDLAQVGDDSDSSCDLEVYDTVPRHIYSL